MKIEKRGKFPGIKLHLDDKECQALLDLSIKKGPVEKLVASQQAALQFAQDVRKQIKDLLSEEPDLLKPRTEEQIKKELELEAKKSIAKLEALSQGQKWDPKKGMKVLVEESE